MISSITSGCPHLQKQKPPAGVLGHHRDDDDDDDDWGGRDLAPCHGFLAQDMGPVPNVPVGAWDNAKRFDVVVVGAGMAGLYTAWKLKRENPSLKVGIYERTEHIGGRARTHEIKGAQRPLDVGAMRFSPSHHPLLNQLCEHFRLPTQEFVVGGDQNLQYFRGERLTNQQVASEPSCVPYKLAPHEAGKTVDQLLAIAIEAVIPDFRTLTREQWVEARQNTVVDGIPLRQMGLQEVLRRTLSEEAVEFVTQAVGYHSYLQNWDAGVALEGLAADFQEGVVYKAPLGGMEAFADAMARDLKRAGSKVKDEYALRQVNWDDNRKHFRLTFQDDDGRARPVICDKLVLAIPKVPMQRLVHDSPQLQNTPLEANLDKVTANPMTRIFVTFDRAWWQEDGIQSGRSVTDLPLGQVYYYGSPGDRRPYIQVYVDGQNQEYWERLQPPGVEVNLCASRRLEAELKRQLEELHGHPIPAPTGFLYRRWADQYFGGAYHTWNPGSQPDASAEAMVQPIAGMPLYVCGEAWSTTQGWIEGALQTSEKVLQKI